MSKAKAAVAAFIGLEGSSATDANLDAPGEGVAGEAEVVGAAPGSAQAGAAGSAGGAADKTVSEARSHLESKDWNYESDRPPYPPGTNKCNLFVYEVLNNSDRPVQMQERWSWSQLGNVEYPPLAGQWADPDHEIPGWEVVTDPQPGDVAAIQHTYRDATGHVGIVTGPNSTVSADGSQVVENDWGFRDGQTPTFRRYVGDAKDGP